MKKRLDQHPDGRVRNLPRVNNDHGNRIRFTHGSHTLQRHVCFVLSPPFRSSDTTQFRRTCCKLSILDEMRSEQSGLPLLRNISVFRTVSLPRGVDGTWSPRQKSHEQTIPFAEITVTIYQGHRQVVDESLLKAGLTFIGPRHDTGSAAISRCNIGREGRLVLLGGCGRRS